MEDVIEDFQERVTELNEYLTLLVYLSHNDAKISIMGKRDKAVETLALKTMKASCFLMLYNLVESCIRGAMTKLYEQMNSEEKHLQEFDSHVKEIWIEQCFRKMEPCSANQSSYRQLIKGMVDKVLDSSSVELDPRKLHLSGNLDAREIRKLFEKHKISTQTHYRAFNGAELRTIKDQRNSLAHGNISFSDCGQQYTVSDIIAIKNQAVVFLRSSLRNIKKHIENTQYAA
ncbi:MAE_28990/MAE_18760 family HEPN-like nuclease [Psychrosphaera sp. 1_MG-2023]|uniref:MAE_28990/MAE_18760 family HEPN-like nuclease n=1 Tax=Psychrosphaera sp. 1_MG-2023 TaxID=3062643 RepID=UPI0026E2DAF1|nr:MAE_28990/MAE_18760 family HEPN-like nuclease [Psychrosphaera sp. 1_MG-2023]MDO6717963.1 MAE_28990/MAE_18760 family HEPN-like nuclease [Psychrosphaera sp. 1_MG-2023]